MKGELGSLSHMMHDTPLREMHEEYVRRRFDRSAAPNVPCADMERPGAASGTRIAPAALEWIPYGPSGESGVASGIQNAVEIVGTFGELEAEYAAIRRGAGLLDCPQRGTLIVTGADRREFLQRMVTADLAALETGIARRAFWLNRKGRIDADLVIMELGDRLLIDLDIHQADRTVETLSAFIITEDVEIRNVTDEFHHVHIHGPEAIALIGCGCASGDDSFTIGQECGARVVIAGADVIIARHDQTGEIGLQLIIARDHAHAVYEALLRADETVGGGKGRVRPIGWYAYNIARIEAGTPLFNIDFGPDSLPHETGVLRDRVSFTKGCYLGQEIVARMESLGKPKQMLVGLRMEGELLPVAGGQVFAIDESGGMGDQIGAVTSSTLSPMLGAAPIVFAVLRTKFAEPGGRVLVNAEGEQVRAVVQGLRFLPVSAEAGSDSEEVTS